MDKPNPPRTLPEFAAWCRERADEFIGDIGYDDLHVPGDKAYDVYCQGVFTRIKRVLIQLTQALAKSGRPKTAANIDIDGVETAQECFGFLHKFAGMCERAEAGVHDQLVIEPEVEKKRRPAYERDHQWRDWYNDKDLETYHSPTKIMERWNREHPERRIKNTDTVKKGLQAAEDDLADEGK